MVGPDNLRNARYLPARICVDISSSTSFNVNWAAQNPPFLMLSEPNFLHIDPLPPLIIWRCSIAWFYQVLANEELYHRFFKFPDESETLDHIDHSNDLSRKNIMKTLRHEPPIEIPHCLDLPRISDISDRVNVNIARYTGMWMCATCADKISWQKPWTGDSILTSALLKAIMNDLWNGIWLIRITSMSGGSFAIIRICSW
jgi:hypothetical protein